MQQFTIPQFIEVEDKIIGPITTRQFIIILAGFLIVGIFYKIFDFSLFVVSGLFILAVSGIIAFAKINGRPFHFFILNVVQTFKKPGLRVWNNNIHLEEDLDRRDKIENSLETTINVPPKDFSSSRLSELSLMVDTRGVYRGEESNFHYKKEDILI